MNHEYDLEKISQINENIVDYLNQIYYNINVKNNQ